jgi:O-antigen/teichoic acid export membrane protein
LFVGGVGKVVSGYLGSVVQTIVVRLAAFVVFAIVARHASKAEVGLAGIALTLAAFGSISVRACR